MKKTIRILLVFFILTSCSTSNNNNNVSENSPKDNTEDITDLSLAEEVFNEFSILVAADAINFRRDPSTTSKENIIDQAYMGETYTVYEQIEDSEYTWYRIGEDRWIANDGTWCIEYDKTGNEEYPHVMNDEEVQDFLSRLDTGTKCLSSDYGDNSNLFIVLNEIKGISELLSGCDMVLAIYTPNMAGPYKYDVSNIVQMDSNTCDIYVVPVEYNGYKDYSTGCFRISNIGPYTGEGYVYDPRVCLYMTLIKNGNNATDKALEEIYGVELFYRVTGAVY